MPTEPSLPLEQMPTWPFGTPFSQLQLIAELRQACVHYLSEVVAAEVKVTRLEREVAALRMQLADQKKLASIEEAPSAPSEKQQFKNQIKQLETQLKAERAEKQKVEAENKMLKKMTGQQQMTISQLEEQRRTLHHQHEHLIHANYVLQTALFAERASSSASTDRGSPLLSPEPMARNSGSPAVFKPAKPQNPIPAKNKEVSPENWYRDFFPKEKFK